MHYIIISNCFGVEFGHADSEHRLLAVVLVARLGSWAIVWSLNHADFTLIFTSILVGHVILSLRVRHLVVVTVLLNVCALQLLLGTLRLRIGVNNAWVSNLVGRMLSWMAMHRIRIPVDVRIVGAMVVAVCRILEMIDYILLISGCCAHIRLVISW